MKNKATTPNTFGRVFRYPLLTVLAALCIYAPQAMAQSPSTSASVISFLTNETITATSGTALATASVSRDGSAGRFFANVSATADALPLALEVSAAQQNYRGFPDSSPHGGATASASFADVWKIASPGLDGGAGFMVWIGPLSGTMSATTRAGFQSLGSSDARDTIDFGVTGGSSSSHQLHDFVANTLDYSSESIAVFDIVSGTIPFTYDETFAINGTLAVGAKPEFAGPFDVFLAGESHASFSWGGIISFTAPDGTVYALDPESSQPAGPDSYILNGTSAASFGPGGGTTRSFTTTTASGINGALPVATPEPSALMSLVMGAATLLGFRRRRVA